MGYVPVRDIRGFANPELKVPGRQIVVVNASQPERLRPIGDYRNRPVLAQVVVLRIGDARDPRDQRQVDNVTDREAEVAAPSDVA